VLLKTVKRRMSEGGKATSVWTPDIEILFDTIEELQNRTTGGVVTSGQNESASRRTCKPRSHGDILAVKVISSKHLPMEWCDRRN